MLSDRYASPARPRRRSAQPRERGSQTPGPKITDILHRGDLVTVSFYLTGNTLRAREVRLVRQAPR